MLVAVAVAVVVFAPQISGFLANLALQAGLTTVAGAFALAGTISSALVATGLAVGLSAGASIFTPRKSITQPTIDRTNSSIVPTAPRKIVFGRTAAGNDVRFQEQYGNDNDKFVQVIAMASHRVNAFLGFYVNDELCYDQSGFHGANQDGFNGFQYVLEGNSTNSFSAGTGSYWTTASRFTGCAYYKVDFHLGQHAWGGSPPNSRYAVVEGCPLYDPRLDSTNGGSGAHRIANQATWAFYNGSVEIGRNPALALLAYLIGYRINGALVWGMGVPPSRIDFANFRQYANICEEKVTAKDGSLVQRYTCDGVLGTADSHETNISSITGAMGSAKLTDVGGQYCLVGGYDDTAEPKLAFSAQNLVGSYQWNPTSLSAHETHNIARGRFADPTNGYQLSDWGSIELDPLADGVPRTLNLDFAMVSRPETAQRIAKQTILRETLTPGAFVATFNATAFNVIVGSLLTLSIPEQGWANKLFRVVEQAETHDLVFQMTLREESAEVYAWDKDEEKELPANIRPQGYDPSQSVAVTGLAATSTKVTGSNNVEVSQVHVTWTPVGAGRVAGLQLDSKLSTSSSWSVQADAADPSLGSLTFTSNAPGTGINIRARYRMSTGVYGPYAFTTVGSAATNSYTDWDNVLDPGGTKPDDNATNSGDPASPFGIHKTVSDVLADVAGLMSSVDSAITPAITSLQSDFAAISNTVSTVSSLANSAASAITVEQGVRSTADSSLSGQITTISAGLNSTNAVVSAETLARSNADTAISATVNSLSSTVGGYSSSISSIQATQSSQSSSLASLQSTLTALANPVTNLVRNTSFTDTSWWGVNSPWYIDTTVHQLRLNTNWSGGALDAVGQPIPASAGQVFSISCEFMWPGLTSGNLVMDLAWIDASSNAIGYSSRLQVSGPAGNYSLVRLARDGSSGGLTAPSGTVYAQPRIYLEIANAIGQEIAVQHIQVERSSTAHSWVDYGADNSNLSAQVAVNSAAISNLQGRTAAYWQVSAVAGNGRAQLGVYADANGGGGVDIVGNVAISGNLTVDGTITTQKLAAGSVTNGDYVAVSGTFYGQGGVSVSPSGYSASSFQQIWSASYNLPAGARLDCIVTFKQSHASSNAPWACRLIIDGVTVDAAWGSAPCDKISLLGSRAVSSGARSMYVEWQGDGAVTVVDPHGNTGWNYR